MLYDLKMNSTGVESISKANRNQNLIPVTGGLELRPRGRYLRSISHNGRDFGLTIPAPGSEYPLFVQCKPDYTALLPSNITKRPLLDAQTTNEQSVAQR